MACLLSASVACAQSEPPWDAPAAPATPTLSAGERWISPAELFAAAGRALSLVLGQRADRVVLSSPRDGAHGLVVDAGPTELVARPLAADTSWSRRVSVWVDVRQAGVTRRSVLVPVQVQAWQHGWVAQRDMVAGTRLTVDQLREDEVDVAAGGQSAWRGLPDGQVLRVPVLAGHYLGQQQVMVPRAVSRGDRVELIHRLGAVQVLASASALQDGDTGQHIQVRPDSSQAAVLARVVEPGRVELLK